MFSTRLPFLKVIFLNTGKAIRGDDSKHSRGEKKYKRMQNSIRWLIFLKNCSKSVLVQHSKMLF
ncbi:hypothetical protein PHSC3_000441 [Chlamydiales bacterium STE3]|nr:hypothetical protein PHSC3_000441 [Chlamydiales bacterium STE3]